MLISRRDVVKLLPAMAFTTCAQATSSHATVVATIEAQHGGRLGVFARDLQSGQSLAYRADERFKLYSSFKGLLAGLVLSDIAAGKLSFDGTLHFSSKDLLPASPITRDHVAAGSLSIEELCEAIMYRSDNTAANLLMARCGGPARLTLFLRGLGDEVTRVDHYEGNIQGQLVEDDTTSPRAIVHCEQELLFGRALPVASREQLSKWMIGNEVGKRRLRASFPPSWQVGDRTGTGDGYCNDYAFAKRATGAPLLVSAYYEAPGMSPEAQEAVLRDVGSAIVSWQES